jgi:hypothetical protein
MGFTYNVPGTGSLVLGVLPTYSEYGGPGELRTTTEGEVARRVSARQSGAVRTFLDGVLRTVRT